MKTILKTGLAAVAIALSASASATVYYVSDCQAGAAAGCVPGNDANAGTSIDAPWRTIAKAQTVIEALKGGDEMRFARGAAFTNAKLKIINPNSRAATPLIFDSYKPTWGAGTQKPIFMAPTGTNALQFEDSGNADHDEGYVIRNLDLRGSGSSTGIFIYNDADYITLDSLDVSNFSVGVNCSESNPPANAASNARNEYITLRNSNISNNIDIGYLGGCYNVLIENNRFDNNGFNPGALLNRNHNIYISSEGENVVIRGNKSTRSAVGAGLCQGVPIVVHGVQKGLVIENNYIDESAGAHPGCYGIQVATGYGSVAESFRGTIIRGNKVINVGGIGIAVGSCPDCVIENNFIVREAPGIFIGIAMPDGTPTGGDALDTNLTVRNNSIYAASPAYGSAGIRVETYGATHKVVSNLIYFGAGASNSTCFSTKGLTLAGFTAFDNNLCYTAGSGTYSTGYATLAAAQAAGFDKNGSNKDPMLQAIPSLANGYAMKAKDGSPLLQAGNAVYSVISGVVNIGAYDRTPPSPPPSVTIK